MGRDEPTDELGRRIQLVIPTLSPVIRWFPGPMKEPGSYQAWLDPARIRWRQDLSQRDRNLAIVHELMHVAVHPPGDPEYDWDDYITRDEPCAHEAANRVAALYEIPDYREAMSRLGVAETEMREGVDPTATTTMLERVTALLESPHVRPVWAERIGN